MNLGHRLKQTLVRYYSGYFASEDKLVQLEQTFADFDTRRRYFMIRKVELLWRDGRDEEVGQWAPRMVNQE